MSPRPVEHIPGRSSGPEVRVSCSGLGCSGVFLFLLWLAIGDAIMNYID